MNSAFQYHYDIDVAIPEQQSATILKFTNKNERKILKAFLLGLTHKLFCELFQTKMQHDQSQLLMESYTMDNKIIQTLIQGIVETGEYTLEGIAFYTRIPLDVIYDVACDINNQISITPWARIVDLYLKVKPDVAQMLFERLVMSKEKGAAMFSELLTGV